MNTICPNCNNNITCPDHYVGKPCICPHCQHSFTAIPTVISQTAPNSKKGKEKASEQESALSLATGTANVCIFFAVLTFIGTLITGIRTYPVPEISRIPLAGFGLIILLALLLSMGGLLLPASSSFLFASSKNSNIVHPLPPCLSPGTAFLSSLPA